MPLFNSVDISIVHEELIPLLNNVYFPNAREPEERSSQLNQGGACHAYIALSIVISDFEQKLRWFLAQPHAEIIRIDSEANQFARKLAYFLGAFQFLGEPYIGKPFAKQPQKDILELAGIDVLKEYSLELNVRKLQHAFNALTTQPCTLFFSLNVHAIKVTYENNRFYILDPSISGTREFETSRQAAKKIFEIFLRINSLSPKTPQSKKFCAEIYLVKKHDDPPTALPEAYMKRIDRMQIYAVNRVLSGTFYRRNTMFTTTVGTEIYKQKLEERTDHKDLLQLIPVTVTEAVLKDPYFIDMLEDPHAEYDPTRKEYKTSRELQYELEMSIAQKGRYIPPTGIEAIIEHYRDDPDKQLIASTLYLLVKKDKCRLIDVLLEDYVKYRDATLIKLLKSEQIIQIANATQDFRVKKIAHEKCVEAITGDEILAIVQDHERAEGDMNFNKAMDVLFKFYFNNEIEDAKKYFAQHQNNPLFKSKIALILENIGLFAIAENKINWFLWCLKICETYSWHFSPKWLWGAFNADRVAALIPLADKYFNIGTEIKPILYAARHCGAEILAFLINYFDSRDSINKTVLNYFLAQLNEFGETALHIAVYKGKKAHVELLLNAGIVPGTANSYNETPLFMACALGFVEIASLILQKSTHHFFIMLDGRNIFYAAKKSPNPNMLNLVVEFFTALYGSQYMQAISPDIAIYFSNPIALALAPMPQALPQEANNTFILPAAVEFDNGELPSFDPGTPFSLDMAQSGLQQGARLIASIGRKRTYSAITPALDLPAKRQVPEGPPEPGPVLSRLATR